MKQLPTGFIDIHSHILPVQDGPSDIGQAIKALKTAEENNITDMILTPHYYSGDQRYDPKYILHTFEKLKQEVERNGLKVRIYLGNECVVDEKLLEDLETGLALTLNKTKYVLCEYPFYQTPCNFNSIIYHLMEKGYKPVLAHPERNIFIEKNYKAIRQLCEDGCIVQLNAGSIIGENGRLSKYYSFMMLKEQINICIASDAHSYARSSPKRLKKSYFQVKKKDIKQDITILYEKLPGKMI